MIIIGYPGIGKSTLAGRCKQYIDLESSNWNGPDNIKPDNWWLSYGKVAEDLSRQGYRVFVSCHKEVQEYLQDSSEYVALCYPSPELKEAWIKRLLDRYERTNLEKDINALINCVRSYSEQIDALERNNFFTHRIILEDINYTLDNEIDSLIWSEQE